MTTSLDVRISPGNEWADAAAGLILSLSDDAIAHRGRMVLALSGGSTPRRLYQTLAGPPWRQRCSWDRMTFLFGDERCVPPDHPESNYGMAETELFRPLRIDRHQVHRMKGELPDAATAARQYEETLRLFVEDPAPEVPRLDLVLLGLGEDGHTASLFPGTAALRDETHLVSVGHAPTGVPLRLTLTLGVINRSSVVLFLVTGAAKAEVVRRVLEPRTEADRGLPASLVKPVHGRLIWILDEAAAATLTSAELRKQGSA